MIDSGATGLFLSDRFAREKGIRQLQLKTPIKVFNIDGTLNQSGSIREFVQLALTVDGHKQWFDFLVTNLGKEDLILGLPWLRRINPQVDWSKGLLAVTEPQAETEETSGKEHETIGGTAEKEDKPMEADERLPKVTVINAN